MKTGGYNPRQKDGRHLKHISVDSQTMEYSWRSLENVSCERLAYKDP